MCDSVTKGISEHRYNEAAGALYSFIWNVFCDWYLELTKPVLNGEDEAAKAETRAMTSWVLEQILIILHPFMPFITEELWHQTAERKGEWLINAAWPQYQGLGDAKADAEMEWVIRFISEVRSVRAEMNVPAGGKIACVINRANAETRGRAESWMNEILRLARLEKIEFSDQVPDNSAQIVLGEAVIALPLTGLIDFSAERARLEKELGKIAQEVGAIEGRLANPGFVAKAPEAVLEENRERLVSFAARRERVEEALNRLS
jgi:valyl-tRNA synthetase